MPTLTSSTHIWSRRWMPAIVVGATYFVAASFALVLTQGLDGTATIWPASGVLIAALLLARPGQSTPMVSAVGIASISVNMLFGSTVQMAASFTAANLIEGVLVSQLVILSLGRGSKLEDKRWLATFFAATVLGCAISSILAAALIGNMSLTFFTSWFTTVCLGTLIVTPLIIALAQERSTEAPDATPRRPWYLLFFTLGVGAAGFILLSYDATRFLYLLMIAVIVAAYMFGTRGAAITIGMIALIATALTDFSAPAPGVLGLNKEVLHLQLFLLCLVCAAWPLSVLLSQKQKLIAQFREANHYLNLTESTAHVGHWYLDNDGSSLTWSNEVYRIHGIDPTIGVFNNAPNLAEGSSLNRYHPEDREAVRTTLLTAMERKEGFTYTARIIRPDGSIRHVCSVGQPRYNTTGQYAGLFGTFHDITEQTELLLELQHARTQALQKAEIAQHLAETDDLTGVANRRKIFADLDTAARLAQRRKEPITVAILDVDHFKSINDRHGHHIGDIVLKKIGKIASNQLRPGDLLGRLGGEEFLVVLPGVNEQNSYNVIERIRQRIATEDLAVAGLESVTVSAGIAILSVGGDVEDALRRADEALYVAKEAGRNVLRWAA